MVNAKIMKKKFLVYWSDWIIVLSIIGIVYFGFYLQQSTDRLKYNNFVFIKNEGFWSTNVNDREIIFNYPPDDVRIIPLKGDVIGKLKNSSEIYITSNFNDYFTESVDLIQFLMENQLNYFNITVKRGYTSKNPQNLPVITCEDATNSSVVLYIKESNVTLIHLKNNCVIAETISSFNVIRTKDRLIYGLLGIMI